MERRNGGREGVTDSGELYLVRQTISVERAPCRLLSLYFLIYKMGMTVSMFVRLT